jgi:L-ribulose-5-phosphate 4-epimerase
MSFNLEEKIIELIQVNRDLKDSGLVVSTWGNVSFRTQTTMYIKPSGVPYEDIQTDDISTIDLATDEHTGGMKPSVDAPTHMALYKHFPKINSIIHTHSKYCTVFAQAKTDIPCLGTTHADYFCGDIPVVKELNDLDIKENYEYHTGMKIVGTFNKYNLSYFDMPAALVPSHGVFVWGDSLESAFERAFVLENIAEMAYKTLLLNNSVQMDKNILNKHFDRKNGECKYYGQ